MIKVILFVFAFLFLFGFIGIGIWKGKVYFENRNNEDPIQRIRDKYDSQISWRTPDEERKRLKEQCEQEIEEFKKNSKKTIPEGKIGFLTGIIGSILALAFVICIPGSFHQVETGEVAIVRHLGKITDVRTPGTYFDFYMVNKYEIYDAKVQQDKIVTAAYSKDGQTMELEVFLQYQIQTEHVIEIATQYGSLDALQARIETVAIERTKAVMSMAEAMTIIQNRAEYSRGVNEEVRDGITYDYYVNVRDVVLTNIDFTDEFEKSIENKVIAEQDKQAAITKAQGELEVAKLEAQKKIEQARGEAESQKIIAQAGAEAATYNLVELARTLGYEVEEEYVFSVDGVERTYIEKVAETDTCIYLRTHYEIDLSTGPGVDNFKSLVEDYLKYIEYLSTWNGELPQVVAGDDAVSIIIPNN